MDVEPPPGPTWAGPGRIVLALRAAATALVVAVAVAAGCGGGGGAAEGPCGPVRREPLDPRSLHVLPGAAQPPEYRTDPPTSGPHLPTPPADPVRDEPIAGPIQVGILEEGGVLIQHVGLSASDRERVEALAGDGVVVAPADELPDDASVVATAWVTKQACDAVDVTALSTFAEDHLDDGPGGHG